MRIAVAGAGGLVGAQVVRLLEADGHEAVRLSRHDGVDLTEPDGLAERLAGADAVVDVTRPGTMELGPAREFFETVAGNLGRAATAAGVPHIVVLSIVGVDEGQDYDWYVATLAHENAVREHAPGPSVLRATQFHQWPGQMLERALEGDRAALLDVPTQPVDAAEVSSMLAEMATSGQVRDVDLAGPRPERLLDLARALAGHEGRSIEVVAGETPASMAGGSMLPGPDAVLRGIDWWTWLRQQPTTTPGT